MKDYKYVEQDVLKHFKACLEEYGKITPTTYRLYRKNKKKVPGQFTVVSRFGWNNMVRKAGSIPQRFRDNEELIGQFRNALLGLGFIPTADEHNALNLKPSVNTLIDVAGGYKEAIIEAGFDYPHLVGKIKAKPNKICSSCHIVFFPKIGKQKYCTANCRDREKQKRYRKERLEKGLCPQCGNKWIEPIETHKGKPKHCKRCQEYYKKIPTLHK